MAYSIKSVAIINDSRALLGVSTAGINTALYVGDVQIQDGQIESTSGVVTFIGDGSRLSGVVTVSDSGGTPEFSGDLSLTGTLEVGAGLTITGISTFNGDLDLKTNDVLNGGTGNFANLVVGTALSFTSAGAGEFVNGISTNLAVADSNDLITAGGAKAYADSIVGAGNTLEFEGNNGVQGEIDLTDGVFDILGDSNEIETNVGGVGFNTITVGLSTTLVVPGTLDVTGLATFNQNVEFGTGIGISFADDADGVLINSIGISSSLAEDTAAETRVVSEKAIKQFVDGVQGQVEAAANLRLEIGDDEFGTVALATQALGINSTTNQVSVTGAGQTFTIGLSDDVSITNTLTVGTGLSISAGNLDFTDAGLQEITGVTSITASGLIQAGDFNSTSDIRKKENIVVIPDALEKVEALRGVTFDWKDGSGKSGGIIAQEVKAVLPTLVKEGDHLTVNYNGLVGLLIEAVKELTARVEELEGKS